MCKLVLQESVAVKLPVDIVSVGREGGKHSDFSNGTVGKRKLHTCLAGGAYVQRMAAIINLFP